MRFKSILTILFLIFVIALLWGYWFFSTRDITLSQTPQNTNSNFNLFNSSNIQFYENLRYLDSNISYRVADICTLQKKADAERAFDILEEKTILNFYSVMDNEEILISCQNRQKSEGGFFVAGEGGPVNITKSGDFRIISYGEVSLIRQSECPNPNVALHEILHALGFNHSLNSNNIMYNVSKCSQAIGEDIPNLLEELYSVPSYPDLIILDANPFIHGKNLDINLTIKNQGIQLANKSILKIYTDDHLINKMDVPELKIGYGLKFKIRNVGIGLKNFDQLRFIIESDFNELDKNNNYLNFSVKK